MVVGEQSQHKTTHRHWYPARASEDLFPEIYECGELKCSVTLSYPAVKGLIFPSYHRDLQKMLEGYWPHGMVLCSQSLHSDGIKSPLTEGFTQEFTP